MTTPEIFSKGLPKTTGFDTGCGGDPEITWEDVLLAFQGTTGKEEGFIRYVYMDDPGGRGNFYAGLFMEAMERSDVRALSEWSVNRGHPGAIDKMVNMALREWQKNKRNFYGWEYVTEHARAVTFGVTRGVWARRHSRVYSQIAAIPAGWEGSVMAILRERLK